MVSIFILFAVIYDCRDDIEEVEFWKRYLNKQQVIQPARVFVRFETIKQLMHVLKSSTYPHVVLEKLIFNAKDVCLMGHTSAEIQFVTFFKMLQKLTFIKSIHLTEWQSQKNNNYRFSIRIVL
jgi:hypothetical protein